MMKRIITRPDFDGIVCAVLLRAAIGNHLTILWVQPSEMQKGLIESGPEDIIANLPMGNNCGMWFDHHVSNKPKHAYEGLYREAPSAAGLIYEYYQNKIGSRFDSLVQQTDKIDSAQLNRDEILHPEKYPHILLSMTITAGTPSDLAYCDDLVDLLSSRSIDEILTVPQVKQRCARVLTENEAYEKHLKNHTRMQEMVSITDFRELDPAPSGNRFLIYSLFPESVVNIKIYNDDSYTVIKLGHSIINENCNVNVGELLARYGGGGHRGAGACRLEREEAETPIQEIISILLKN